MSESLGSLDLLWGGSLSGAKGGVRDTSSLSHKEFEELFEFFFLEKPLEFLAGEGKGEES